MANNVLNREEAEKNIRRIGVVLENLTSACVLVEDHNDAVFRDTKVQFFEKTNADNKEIHRLLAQLQAGHEELSKSFRRYADRHAEVSANY